MYIESPNPTMIVPKTTYGRTFKFFKSFMLIRKFAFLALCVFSASFRLVLSAFLIGTIALRAGIKRPMKRAYRLAFASGNIVGWKPISEVKSI